MNEQFFSDDRHDAFGWLKTTVWIVVLFAVMIVTSVLAAKADTCAPACRERHNQCRIQTKGSPSCDAQLQSCLQACIASQVKK